MDKTCPTCGQTLPRIPTNQFGDYIAVNAKLDMHDSREAYVTKTCADGHRRPIASFWTYSEATIYAAQQHKEDQETP